MMVLHLKLVRRPLVALPLGLVLGLLQGGLRFWCGDLFDNRRQLMQARADFTQSLLLS